jgi:predicted ribosomally synthesized peptide with SipW-like signal peptide
MKRSILLSAMVIATAVTVLAVAGTQALFTDSQTASGDVNTGTINLYLLEPSTADDNGEDEFIFESTENLLPGQSAQYDLRLRNDGTAPLTITALDFSGSIGADCDGTNPGDEFVPTIVGVSPGAVIPVGGVVDTTVHVSFAAAADDDCQGVTFTVILDIDATS